MKAGTIYWMAGRANTYSVSECVRRPLFSCLMFHHCVFRHNNARVWLKSRQPFTFSRHNVKNPPPRPLIKCGHWPYSPAASPICPNPSGPYPFVLMDANATNWLGTINLQMISFVLTLSPISLSFSNTLFVQPWKIKNRKNVQSAMWPNWSLQTAGWWQCRFEFSRHIGK